MQVTLSPELEKFARAEVARGHFKSVTAVVSAAMKAVRANGTARKPVNKKIKAQIQAGIDAIERGEYTTYDAAGLQKLAADISREGRAELASSRKRAAKS